MRYVFILIVWSFMLCAFAGSRSPYQIELPAESQADSLRMDLMKKGLKQVLAEVSGNPRIEKNAEVKTKLNHPDRFVQEYRYISATDDVHTKYLLRVRYNKNAVLAILTKAGAIKNSSHKSTELQLKISNIKQSNDVHAILSYFERMENVEKVELAEIAGDVIHLVISISGERDAFLQETSRNQHLVLKSELHYEWSR